ncbi:MAG: phospho-N-acetylmuramoyl-pentapeptide-transferase, partial [Candidatus Binatia bacterium]
VLFVTAGCGAIGFVDDWRKAVRKDPEGIRGRTKLWWPSRRESAVKLLESVATRRTASKNKKGAIEAPFF